MEEVVKVRKTSDGSIEIVEYKPYTSMTIVQKTGPVPFKATYLYRPLEGGTRFSMQIEAEPGGGFKLATPLVRRQLKAQFERLLKNLKAILEKPDE
jgi:hypothetical protein